MSLARLALRAATVDLLTNGGSAPYPTMAGHMVFDSRVDSLEHIASQTMLPAAVVYTNGDTFDRETRRDRTVFTQRRIELVIEMVIGTFSKDALAVVETDAEMEALLDLFEWQIWRALSDNYNPRTATWARMVKAIQSWTSAPARVAEQANRLAMRQMVIAVDVANDCLPQAVVLPNGARHELPGLAGPLLDIPYLAALDTMIRKECTFETLREQLREARTGVPSTTLPLFERLGIRVDFIDPADPNRLAQLNRTTGPDGRIEVAADVLMQETT